MTENKTRQYTDNKYNRTPDHELGSDFQTMKDLWLN